MSSCHITNLLINQELTIACAEQFSSICCVGWCIVSLLECSILLWLTVVGSSFVHSMKPVRLKFIRKNFFNIIIYIGELITVYVYTCGVVVQVEVLILTEFCGETPLKLFCGDSPLADLLFGASPWVLFCILFVDCKSESFLRKFDCNVPVPGKSIS